MSRKNSLPEALNDVSQDECARMRCQIRMLLGLFVFGLVISGATAIPLESELKILTRWVGGSSSLALWLANIRTGVEETNKKYPFMAYGTDWLAFGHFAIAIAFIGPLRDPIKNFWVVNFGMSACVLIVPFALVMGGMRGIPLGWGLMDCSFGVLGIIPLWFCRRLIKKLSVVQGVGGIGGCAA